jgi:predicted nicotinamide N-methyase
MEDDTIEVRDLRVGKGADQRVLHMVTDNVNEHFRSCGASVWLGSQVLLRFMEKELRSRRLESARIVELGAGCGLPGMGLAQLGFCDVDVVLTDVPSQCALLECNVALNFFKSGRIAQVRKNIPRVMPLLWGSRSHLDDFFGVEEQWGGFDYIIGSEIVYDEVSLPRLLRTLKTLAALPTETETASRIILAVGERAGEFSQFEQLAVRHGWNYEILSQVDLTASIGDPTCSPVSIVELFQSETRRRRSRSSSVGGFAAASWSDED